MNQTVLLTQNIEDFFEANKKADAVFVNLTTAYDTVWHRSFTCKLLRLLPDKHMLWIILFMVRGLSKIEASPSPSPPLIASEAGFDV